MAGAYALMRPLSVPDRCPLGSAIENDEVQNLLPQRLEVSISRVPAAEGTNNGVHQGRPLRGRSRAQNLRDDLLSFDTTLSTSCPGLSAGRTLNEMIFSMSKQLRYIISVIIIILAAALTASAQSISVELAEKTPPVDENGQF